MRIFITGITGLLGQHFAKHYAQQGHPVIGIARKPENAPLFFQKLEINVLKGDVLDIHLLNELILPGDLIIHCAALVSFNPRDKEEVFKVNHEGTENIVNIALSKANTSLIYISSVAALGKPVNIKASHETVIINEEQMWLDGPDNSNYAKSKFLGETEVSRGQAEGLNTIIINPSVILGENNWSQSSSRLFKYVWDQNKFQTKGFLNYVDVEDVVLASASLFDKKLFGQRFILNAGRVPFGDFFDQVGILFDKKTKRTTLSRAWIEVLWRLENLRSLLLGSDPLITKDTALSAQLNVLFDHSKIVEDLDYSFKPLEESLQRITSFYLKQAK